MAGGGRHREGGGAAEGPAPEMSRPQRLDRILPGRPLAFDERADAAERAAVARLLGALEVGRLRFSGRIAARPEGGHALAGLLEATVVQACGVSLRPVPQRIREEVRRLWIPGLAAPGPEVDPDAEEAEPWTARIDLGAIAVEAVALALDPWPRHPDAALDPAAGDGAAGEAGPFAALGGLGGKGGPGDGD